MTSENETVTEIVGEMRGSTEQKYCSSKHRTFRVYNPILDFADRIEAAYKWEVAELRKYLNSACNHICANYSKVFDSKCGNCIVKDKWRKVLKGAEDES